MSVDHGVEHVLVGEAGGEHRHKVGLGNKSPNLGPVCRPQDHELHEDHTSVEASVESRPGPVVLPELSRDVPVTLVLDQTESLARTKPLEDRPQPTNVCGKGDVSVEDDDATKVMGENLGQGELEEAKDTRVVLVRDPGNILHHLLHTIEVERDLWQIPSGCKSSENLARDGVREKVKVDRVPPVEQDRLDQRDNSPARVGAGAHDRHVDELAGLRCWRTTRRWWTT